MHQELVNAEAMVSELIALWLWGIIGPDGTAGVDRGGGMDDDSSDSEYDTTLPMVICDSDK